MTTIYTTEAHASAGREGSTALADGTMSFDLSMPGSGKPGTNPEQLFAMGYAACFDGAAKAMLRQMKLPAGAKTETHVKVSLVKDEAGFKIAAEVGLRTEGLDRAQSEALLAAAHRFCPYSRALRGDSDVTVRLLD